MNLWVRERAATAGTGGAGRLVAEAGQRLPAPLTSPFPIVVGPEQVVRHRSWREARDQVLAALRAGNGPMLVAAPSGAGKTLFLRALAQELREGGADVLLLPHGDSPFPGNAVGTGRRRVVLIDEAERIGRATLDRLRQLGECAVVLAATSAPGATLGGAGTVVRLAALARDEVGAFVAARLSAAGLDRELVSDAAAARLAELSEGLPRALNRLAGAALLLARLEGSPRVEADHVDRAATRGDASADWNVLAPDALRPAGAEPERANPLSRGPLSRGMSDGGHAAALPVTAEGARTGVKPFIAAFAAVSVLVLCGSLLLRPGAMQGSPPSDAARADRGTLAPSAPPEDARRSESGRIAPPNSDARCCSHALSSKVAHGAAPPSAPRGADAVPPPPVPAAPRTERVASVPLPPAPERRSPADARAPEILAVPDTGPARSEAPLPISAPALVAVRYDRGPADAPSRAAAYALTLRAAGFAVDGPAPVARERVRPGVHYLFEEDRGTAEAVLKALGLPGREAVADLPKRRLSSRPGLIEFVMPPDEAEASTGGRSPDGGRS